MAIALYTTSYENFKKIVDNTFPKPNGISYLNDARGYGDFFQDGKLSLFTTSLTYDFKKSQDQATPSKFQFWSYDGSSWEERKSVFDGDAIGSIHPRKSLVADFNGDKIPDIFVVSHGYDANPFPGETNKIILSQGSGKFTVKNASPDKSFFHGGSAADIDSDGDIDVLLASGYEVSAFLNDGKGGFTKDTVARFPSSLQRKSYYSIELIDINEDQKPDLFIGGHEWENSPTLLFTNPGNFNFSQVSPVVLPPVSGEGVVLDFLVTGLASEKSVWILRSSGGDGTFYQSTVLQRVLWPGLENSVVLNQRNGVWTPWIVSNELEERTLVVSDSAQRLLSYQALSSINISISSDQSHLHTGQTALITFSLSQPSTNFSLTDITVVGGSLTSFSGSGSLYTARFIPANNSRTEGTITVATGVFTDLSGNPNGDGSESNNRITISINTVNLRVHDSSVTNDTKVVVTRVGDITRIEGNQENNTVVGTDAIDRLFGGGGADRFYSSKGNDVLDGGDGTDAVTFRGKATDFRVEKSGGNWLVRDTRSDASVNQGEDTLTGVERVAFEDKVLALDTDGVAGKAYRVYKAAFNRDPMAGDTAGLGFWIDRMDNAMDLIEVSARFVDSNEFRSLYGTNPTNEQFLTKLYQNVLGRQPEASGFNWWLNELNTNPEKTKAKVLADFAESAENQAGVINLIGNGITYEPWVG